MSKYTKATLYTLAARVVVVVLALGCMADVVASPNPPKIEEAYGTPDLDRLDIYPLTGAGPFACVINIHGGGWWNGDKYYASRADLDAFSSNGIVFVSINYRNLPAARDAGLFPPVRGPLLDAKRALQYIRYNARRLHIDPARIALMGDSAGGFDALWLGLSRDLANPRSSDPIERMSTKVKAVAAIDAQTSIDPRQMRDWVGPGLDYGGHAFGLPEADFDAFLADRRRFEPYFASLSPAALVNASAPPILLFYHYKIDPGSTEHMYFVHSPLFGVGFTKLATARGADVRLITGGNEDPAKARDIIPFLVKNLR